MTQKTMGSYSLSQNGLIKDYLESDDVCVNLGVRIGSVVVEALCYKPEGGGLETRRGE
jgi:hypothetical protein